MDTQSSVIKALDFLPTILTNDARLKQECSFHPPRRITQELMANKMEK
jgi:hypothetical protein